MNFLLRIFLFADSFIFPFFSYIFFVVLMQNNLGVLFFSEYAHVHQIWLQQNIFAGPFFSEDARGSLLKFWLNINGC